MAQPALVKPDSDLQIRPVRNPRDLRRFIDFPYKLYRDYPHWVPPLRLAQKDILNTQKHPFYKTSDVEMFLAERSGRVVGRVMAILNRAHNEFHQENAGFFGFFESENEPATGRGLLDEARGWLSSKGAVLMRGPVNPSTNYECGLLVDSFDRDPTVMMTYNPPYYAEMLESYGLNKAMDLWAYDTGFDYFIHSEKLARVTARLKTKYGVRLRNVNVKDFKREVEIVREVYNAAWSRNWGFVPVSREEFEHLAKDLKQLVDPRVVFIAERTGQTGEEPKPIGFFLAVPDINRALKHTNGRLFPFGLIKLLWYSRKIGFIRIITMGVVPEVQSLGIASVFYDEIYRQSPITGYLNGEVSWVLENNVLMNRAADMMGARRSKTYRIYEMPIRG
jgi:hypothetical protein